MQFSAAFGSCVWHPAARVGQVGFHRTCCCNVALALCIEVLLLPTTHDRLPPKLLLLVAEGYKEKGIPRSGLGAMKDVWCPLFLPYTSSRQGWCFLHPPPCCPSPEAAWNHLPPLLPAAQGLLQNTSSAAAAKDQLLIFTLKPWSCSPSVLVLLPRAVAVFSLQLTQCCWSFILVGVCKSPHC